MIGNPTFAQDCDYVKIVLQYENGKIVNSKTEYVCESPPTIIVNYLKDKKKKKPHWSDNFKPIRTGHSPDPTMDTMEIMIPICVLFLIFLR